MGRPQEPNKTAVWKMIFSNRSWEGGKKTLFMMSPVDYGTNTYGIIWQDPFDGSSRTFHSTAGLILNHQPVPEDCVLQFCADAAISCCCRSPEGDPNMTWLALGSA